METFLTQEKVHEAFVYNIDSGLLIWKQCVRTELIGLEAGYITGNRILVEWNGQQIYAHRLIWMYMKGSLPIWPNRIDHKDGNGLNNKWKNLREVTHSQNLANAERRSHGVAKHGNKYRARLMKDRIQYNIGSFETREEAEDAYIKKHLELFGEYSIYARDA